MKWVQNTGGCKDKAREEFAFNQKVDETVCKVLSKVFKEFIELKD